MVLFGFLVLLGCTQGQATVGWSGRCGGPAAQCLTLPYLSADQGHRRLFRPGSGGGCGSSRVGCGADIPLYEGPAARFDSVPQGRTTAPSPAGSEKHQGQAVATVPTRAEGSLFGAEEAVHAGLCCPGSGLGAGPPCVQSSCCGSTGYGQWQSCQLCTYASCPYPGRGRCLGSACWALGLARHACVTGCGPGPSIAGGACLGAQCAGGQLARCAAASLDHEGTPRSAQRPVVPPVAAMPKHSQLVGSFPATLLPGPPDAQYLLPTSAAVDPYMPSPSQVLTPPGRVGLSPKARSPGRPKQRTSVKESAKVTRVTQRHAEAHVAIAEQARQQQLQMKRDQLSAGAPLPVPVPAPLQTGRPPELPLNIILDDDRDVSQPSPSSNALGGME